MSHYTDADVRAALTAVLQSSRDSSMADDIRTVLDAVAPAIRTRAKAEAWDEGARAVQGRLATFGSAAAMPSNPYRADEIEQGQP